MRLVVFGGTFDRLHKGHRDSIKAAFSISEKVVFGVTDQGLVGGKTLSKIIQPQQDRIKELEMFLKESGFFPRASISSISRVEGDADTNEAYEGIIVTAETKDRALSINQERRRQGLRELVLIELPLVLAEDGEPISSTRIRAGAIDRGGKRLQKREITSKVRENIARILGQGPEYGYIIHKKYKDAYGKISLRLVYYHLAKGVDEGIFEVSEKKSQGGGYSWGRQSERVYYKLGPRFS